MNTALSLYPAIDCCVSTTTRDPQDRETRKVSICVEPPIVTIPYPFFILKNALRAAAAPQAPPAPQQQHGLFRFGGSMCDVVEALGWKRSFYALLGAI